MSYRDNDIVSIWPPALRVRMCVLNEVQLGSYLTPGCIDNPTHSISCTFSHTCTYTYTYIHKRNILSHVHLQFLDIPMGLTRAKLWHLHRTPRASLCKLSLSHSFHLCLSPASVSQCLGRKIGLCRAQRWESPKVRPSNSAPIVCDTSLCQLSLKSLQNQLLSQSSWPTLGCWLPFASSTASPASTS